MSWQRPLKQNRAEDGGVPESLGSHPATVSAATSDWSLVGRPLLSPSRVLVVCLEISPLLLLLRAPEVSSTWAASTFALFQFSAPWRTPHGVQSAEGGGGDIEANATWRFALKGLPSGGKTGRGRMTSAEAGHTRWSRPGANQGTAKENEHRAQSWARLQLTRPVHFFSG